MKNPWFIFIFVLTLIGYNSLTFASGDTPILAPKWETSGFKAPESAVYDASRKVIYVSNINGAPTEKNGAGFISKIYIDGHVQELNWVSGFDAPKGMALRNDILYVSDLDGLVEVNVKTGQIIKRHTVANPQFLNDVAIDSSGNVYLSDMGANSIYRLSNGELKLWVKSEELEFPNGILVEGNQLIVASWGVITEPETFGTEVPGHIHRISLDDKQISSMGNTTPIGNLDGIESDGSGNYFVSDWGGGKIYFITPDAKVDIFLTLKLGSADIDFIKERKLLLIPMMMEGKLMAYSIQ